MADSCCSAKSAEIERLAQRVEQRRVHVIVLAINAAMFLRSALRMSGQAAREPRAA